LAVLLSVTQRYTLSFHATTMVQMAIVRTTTVSVSGQALKLIAIRTSTITKAAVRIPVHDAMAVER